jgi:hypothetical protein
MVIFHRFLYVYQRVTVVITIVIMTINYRLTIIIMTIKYRLTIVVIICYNHRKTRFDGYNLITII